MKREMSSLHTFVCIVIDCQVFPLPSCLISFNRRRITRNRSYSNSKSFDVWFSCLESFIETTSEMKYFEIILLTILSSSSYGERIYAPEFIGLSQLTQEYFLFSDSTPETQFEEYPTCKYGHRQTPIDISEPFEPTDLQLEFSRNYHEPVSKVGINNNGHYRK